MTPEIGQIWRTKTTLRPYINFYWKDEHRMDDIVIGDSIIITKYIPDTPLISDHKSSKIWVSFTLWGHAGDVSIGALEHYFTQV